MIIEEKYSTFWRRFGAIFLDGAALAPMVWLDQIIWNNITSIAMLSVWVVLQQGVYLSFYIGFLYKYGQTPGKMAMGVIVLDHKDRILSFNQSLLRNIVELILTPVTLVIVYSNLLDGELLNRGMGNMDNIMQLKWLVLVIVIWGALEMITMLFNEKRRALHDFIAGTVVVRQSADSRIKGFKSIRIILIGLFIADFIVPSNLPEKNMTPANMVYQTSTPSHSMQPD